MARVSIKSAKKARNVFDMSCTHLTTLNIGQIVPIYTQQLIPGDEITIDESYFARLAPLPVPTYGMAELRTAAFFCPYHNVSKYADTFLSGEKYYNGTVASLPAMSQLTIDLLFVDNPSQMYVQDATEASCDFAVKTSSGFLYSKLKPYGKYVYKILRSLGYAVSPNLSNDGNNQPYQTQAAKQLNPLPLLTFFRCYNDFMSRSLKYSVSPLSTFIESLRSGSTNLIDYQHLHLAFSSIYLTYDESLFTSAWQNISQPYNSSLQEVSPFTKLNSITGGFDSAVYSGQYGQFFSTVDSSVSHSISERSLRYITAFAEYIRRNNYSGSKYVDILLSRFGIKVSDYDEQFAKCLGTRSFPLTIGDITNTAAVSEDNVGQFLGSYAGKGILSGQGGYAFQSKDYGSFIILAWIAPKVTYYQGVDREVLKREVSDFYTPEYDGQGMTPITFWELGRRPDKKFSTTVDPYQVFGFSERYYEMRNPINRITGDFSLLGTNASYDSWHYGRDMTTIYDSQEVAQGDNVTQYNPSSKEWNRIFVDTNVDVDHFFVNSSFKVTMMRNIMNNNQVTMLGEGETKIEKNGSQLQ
ncbi:major capsid protein [Capybara microvirus Cap3_SP_407]|nr:major capsid protein [Capybara microvirus Cap3_SP_407]